jgi:hypothetical protein
VSRVSCKRVVRLTVIGGYSQVWVNSNGFLSWQEASGGSTAHEEYTPNLPFPNVPDTCLSCCRSRRTFWTHTILYVPSSSSLGDLRAVGRPRPDQMRARLLGDQGHRGLA